MRSKKEGPAGMQPPGRLGTGLPDYRVRKACRAGALQWEDSLQPFKCGLEPWARSHTADRTQRREGICFKSCHEPVAKLGLEARSCCFPTMF